MSLQYDIVGVDCTELRKVIPEYSLLQLAKMIPTWLEDISVATPHGMATVRIRKLEAGLVLGRGELERIENRKNRRHP